MCPGVRVVLTWRLLPPGLWTVNRRGNGVGTQAEHGGGGGHDGLCSSQRKGSPGPPPPPPHAGHLAPRHTVRRGPGQAGLGCRSPVPPLPLPRSPSLPPDFPSLLVSADVPGRDLRGRFSALAQHMGSASRLPSSGRGRLTLPGIKPLEDLELGGRRREAALPGPRDPNSPSPFRGFMFRGNVNLLTLAQRAAGPGQSFSCSTEPSC